MESQVHDQIYNEIVDKFGEIVHDSAGFLLRTKAAMMVMDGPCTMMMKGAYE